MTNTSTEEEDAMDNSIYPKPGHPRQPIIHTLLKSSMHGIVNTAWVIGGRYCVNSPEELKSDTVRKIWVAIERAMENTLVSANHKYRETVSYDTITKILKMAMTILDNDRPYINLSQEIESQLRQLDKLPHLWQR